MHDDFTTPRPPAEPSAPSGDSDEEALLDREVCLCFHVPLRKIIRHMQLNPTRVASQLSECYGAGTGCGWCIPHLEHLHEQFHRGESPRLSMTPEDYARRRKAWKQSKRRDWTPPDAITSPMTSPDASTSPNPASDAILSLKTSTSPSISSTNESPSVPSESRSSKPSVSPPDPPDRINP